MSVSLSSKSIVSFRNFFAKSNFIELCFESDENGTISAGVFCEISLLEIDCEETT